PEGSSPEVGFIADQVWTVDPGKEGMLAYKDAGVAWDVTPPNPVDTINPVTMAYGVLGNVSDVSHLPRRYTVNFVWHTPPIEVMVDPYSRNLFRIEVNGLKRSDGETGSILFLAVDKRAEDGAVIMTVGRDGLWTQS